MRLLVTIVEGDHDAVFVERSLQTFAGFTHYFEPLARYPAPLGGGATTYLLRYVSRNAQAQLNLREATARPRPSIACALRARDTIALVFESHGVDRDEAAVLVNELAELFGGGDVNSEFTSVAFAFITDADTSDATTRAAQVVARHGATLGLTGLIPDTWTAGTKHHALVHVFAEPGKTSGALEHHLGPLVELARPAEWKAACAFIDQTTPVRSRLTGNAGRRLKALITCAGQFEHPGLAMSKMIRYEALGPEVFKTSAEARRLAALLVGFP